MTFHNYDEDFIGAMELLCYDLTTNKKINQKFQNNSVH